MMKACKECKRLTEGKECPVCRSKNLTVNFQGVIVVFSGDSEVAQTLGITSPGMYAIKV